MHDNGTLERAGERERETERESIGFIPRLQMSIYWCTNNAWTTGMIIAIPCVSINHSFLYVFRKNGSRFRHAPTHSGDKVSAHLHRYGLGMTSAAPLTLLNMMVSILPSLMCNVF